MVGNNTYFQALHSAKKQHKNSREDIIERLFLDRLNWRKADLIVKGQQLMPTHEYTQFCSDLKRLILGEPVQYIIGKEWFYNREFHVNTHVLIPRPETEQLVEMVINSCQLLKSPKIIDVGTGSGVIGITLKKELPHASVTLTDISKQALLVASENAKLHKAQVHVVESDVFKNIVGTYDVIVSNPPYIAYNELHVMDKSVIDFEPHLALFADNNGLVVYEKIAQQAQRVLSEVGMIFVEIGYAQGNAVAQLFKQYFPNKQVVVHKDYAKNDRMISVK